MENMPKILVIGDIMLDVYINGTVERVSPEAPVPVLKFEKEDAKLGGAANLAKNLTELACDVKLIGCIGNDKAGKEVVHQLKLSNISFLGNIINDVQTITKTRFVSGDQQLLRLDDEGEYHQYAPDLDLLEDLLDAVDLVVISDYGKGAIKDCGSLIALANRKSKNVFVDPKGNDFSKYYGAFALKPNFSEFEAVVGVCNSDSEIFGKADILLNELKLTTLIITRNSIGCYVITNSEKLKIPAPKVNISDVSGAGDNFLASFVSSYNLTGDFIKSARVATNCSSLSVSRRGTSTVFLSEFQNEMREGKKFLGTFTPDGDRMLSEFNYLKKSTQKIVFTNGCFDIIHPGHLKLLNFCKSQGDIVVCAIDTDASVSQLKGEDRPINSLSQRVSLISELEAVDIVIGFNSADLVELVSALRPDILVKGGDYIKNEITGAEIVFENGGDVLIFPLENGFSTSSIITRVKGD